MQNSCLVGRQKQLYHLDTNDLDADLKFSLRRVGPQAFYKAALEQQRYFSTILYLTTLRNL